MKFLVALMCDMLLLLIPQAAQPAAGNNYTAHFWQPQNGLPGETVQAFAQTADGYLWIGTNEGLARFDGHSFTLFTRESTPELRESSVFCLLVGHDGALWIGTEGGGLVRYAQGVFHRYTASNGLGDGFVRSLFEDHAGALWVATDNGLFRKNNEHFTRIDNRPAMPANAFHAVLEDHRGRLWAGAPRLYALINGQPQEFALDGTDSQNRVKSILETTDGSIWVGTVSGLHRLRPGALRFERVRGVEGTIRTLCVVNSSELWAGAIGQGIFRIRYNEHATTVTHQAAPSPDVSNTTLSIFADSAHRLWVGTQVGMVRLSQTPVRVLALPGAADSDFGTISLDADGSLWAASNQLVHVSGEQTRPHHFAALGEARARNLLRTRDGALWVGTDGSGLFRIGVQGVAHYTIQQGLANNFIRCMIEAHDGSLWIGMDEGVSHFNGTAFRNITVRNGLAYFSTRALLEDHNGDIWVGTERGLTHLHQSLPVRDRAIEILRDEKIWALHEDTEGSLWIGTRSNGLYRYRNGQLTHYTTTNGLASNSIYSILEDSHLHMWLSGPAGVMLLNRGELDTAATDAHRALSVRFYRGDAGDQPTLFYGGTQPAGVLTREDEAWFPTNRGLWHIRATDFDAPPLEHLHIGVVKIDGRTAPPATALQLSAASTRIEIGFEPVMLGSQENLVFRYRLEHFDRDWTVTSEAQRSATYTNLPAGHYRFLLEAWQREDPGHRMQVTLILDKQPYFYRTLWFIGGCLLLAALLAILAYRMCMRQVHARYRAVLDERTRLAREMHDTLIQGCASVSAMLEAAASKEIDDEDSRRHLVEYASTQIRATMDEARQAVWNLREDETVARSLPDCLRQMAERLEREAVVTVHLRTEGVLFPLAQTVIHELTMVAREAIYNAVLHGAARTIDLELFFESSHIALLVRDDGSGFDSIVTHSPDGHYGLQGMRERVARLGGKVEIESQKLGGTIIKVSIPCKRLRREPA